MKKILVGIVVLALSLLMLPKEITAAGGIYPSAGGTKTVGQSFTINVTASGATFDSLQGVISVSGPVSVISFSPGGATWLPGKTPANGTQFVGITSTTNSLTVASILLKATAVGNGAVTVSGARLALSGNEVGTGAGSAGFTIQKAPNIPGAVKVSSSTHPDQNESYEAATIELSWDKSSKVKGFSYLLDQTEDTTPETKITSTETSTTYADQAVGTHFFHIRAQGEDGWGSTTHFKINIKEPPAKVDEKLSKPSSIRITKNENFSNNLENGTVTGITISGKTENDFMANITLDPEPTLPESITLSTPADKNGYFSMELDFPIKSGFYKLTIQGQKDKVLTPISDEIKFELSLAKGGEIRVLSQSDISKEPISAKVMMYYGIAIIIVMLLVAGCVVIIKRKRTYKDVYQKSE